MDLIELFPKYPDISSDTFYRDIYEKKEFRDLQSETVSESTSKKYYKHQLFVSRFISNWTLYQSLILIHETGTGKSGVAAAVFDGLKRYNPQLRTLYITNNDNLLENFKEEIFHLSHRLHHLRINQESSINVDESNKSYIYQRNAILAREGFYFTTYYKFATDYMKTKDKKGFHQSWEKQLIIMDEVHHLVSHEVEKEKEERTASSKMKLANLNLLPFLTLLGDVENLNKKKDYEDVSSFIATKTLSNELLKLQTKNYATILQTTCGVLMNEIKTIKAFPIMLQRYMESLQTIITMIKNKQSIASIKKNLQQYPKIFNKIQQYENIPSIVGFLIQHIKKLTKTIGANIKPYDEIYDFVQSLQYKKMILLTATPMRDSPSEIAPLLNLALPKSNPIAIGDTFIHKYFTSTNTESQIPLLSWKTDQKKQFQDQIKGIISFLRIKTDIQKTYEGTIYPPMKHFKLYAQQMSPQQANGYKIAFNLDTSFKKNETSFYSNSQQASLFVFPDGSFGIKKTNKYLDTKGGFNLVFKKETGLQFFERKPLSKITSDDHHILQKNLTIIKNMSITYHSIIKQILDNRNKKIYVYCHKINGSGIKICIALLTQFFGYTQLKSPKKCNHYEKLPRCIYLHESEKETSKSDISQLIKDCFNPPENLYGDSVQVIFGTDKTREGISLKGIQQIHICSGDWNFGKIFQAIGRGIRLNSHAGLPKNTLVQLFLHCAIPPKNILTTTIIHQKIPEHVESHDYTTKQLFQSIDFFQYFRSELKDINIKKIEHALMVNAVDCQIHKAQNLIKGSDNTTDCMYQPCHYDCTGFSNVSQKEIHALPIDYSTYNLYYIQTDKKETIQFILNLFYTKTIMCFQDILKMAKKKNITQYALLEALISIIETPIQVPFLDGRRLYMNNAHNAFFLSEDRIQTDPKSNHRPLWIADYSKNPSFKISPSFDSFMIHFRDEKFQTLCSTLYELCKLDKKDPAIKIIHLFSDAFFFIFMAILVTTKDKNPFINWLKQILTEHLVKKNDVWYLKKGGKIYSFDGIQKAWVVEKSLQKLPVQMAMRQGSMQTQDHNSESFYQKYISNKIAYGFIEDGKFKIRDVSHSKDWKNKKTSTKGKVCTSYDFPELLYFLYKIDQTIPSIEGNTVYSKLIKNSDEMLRIEASNHETFEIYLELIQKNVASVTRDDLLFFLYFYKTFYNHKKDFCPYLLDIFTKHQLITKPPSKK